MSEQIFEVVEGGEREEGNERGSKYVELKVVNSRAQAQATQTRVCQNKATVVGDIRDHSQRGNILGAALSAV